MRKFELSDEARQRLQASRADYDRLVEEGREAGRRWVAEVATYRQLAVMRRMHDELQAAEEELGNGTVADDDLADARQHLASMQTELDEKYETALGESLPGLPADTYERMPYADGFVAGVSEARAAALAS